MAMTLGTYTFATGPDFCTQPLYVRRCSSVETYGGSDFISYGVYIAGQPIEVKWGWMLTTMFNAIYALLLADEQVVWDPETGDTYNVEIKSFTGDFFKSTYPAANRKKNVVLKLEIISEVT
jgi:hypothetical protein